MFIYVRAFINAELVIKTSTTNEYSLCSFIKLNRYLENLHPSFGVTRFKIVEREIVDYLASIILYLRP